MRISPYVHYSIVAVAAVALAACGSDRNAASNRPAATDTARNNNPGANPNYNSADRATGVQLSSTDRDFITKAAQGGMAEVQMGLLAEQKAADPRVKEYGRKLQTDHTKANDQLKSIAEKGNLTLPTALDSSDRSELDKLQKLNGKKFDQEFLKRAIDDHKKDIKEFENQADKGTDPALKEFAQNTLPALRDHLETAEGIYHR